MFWTSAARVAAADDSTYTRPMPALECLLAKGCFRAKWLICLGFGV
jgi:hypothetical protein